MVIKFRFLKRNEKNYAFDISEKEELSMHNSSQKKSSQVQVTWSLSLSSLSFFASRKRLESESSESECPINGRSSYPCLKRCLIAAIDSSSTNLYRFSWLSSYLNYFHLFTCKKENTAFEITLSYPTLHLFLPKNLQWVQNALMVAYGCVVAVPHADFEHATVPPLCVQFPSIAFQWQLLFFWLHV